MSSNVWKYFSKIGKNEAQCNFCLKRLKTGGGTTNLRQHLNHKHPTYKDEKSKTQKEFHSETESVGTSSLDTFFPPGPSASTSTPSSFSPTIRSRSPTPSTSLSVSKPRQMTLFEAVERTSWFERGGKRDVQITDALIFMICKDNAPHSIVEREGFMHFTKTVAPLYKLPSRNTVTQMVTSRYNAITTLIKSKLEDVQHFSLTSDICTIVNTSRSFLVVTAHFLCLQDNILETIMLGVRRLTEAHTGDYVALEIGDLLESFAIPKEKIVSVCTNGGANMIAGVRKLFGEGKNVQCLAHVLNLVVVDGLDDPENVNLKELIGEVKQIITYARHSNLFMDCLRAEQLKEGKAEGNILLFVQSVPTRWNSTYFMIERFVKLSPYVARVLAGPNLKKAPRMLSGSEIEQLSEIVTVLKPFQEATAEISGSEYLTGSLVIPIISNIETALSTVTPANIISQVLLNKVKKS